MLLWRKQNPDASASAYNREWDSVYRKLEGEFSDKPELTVELLDRVHQKLWGSGSHGNERRVLIHPARTMSAFGVSCDGPKPRRRRKHAAQTKGAFGKRKPCPHR